MKYETFLVIFSLFIMGIYDIAATTGGELPIASEKPDIPSIEKTNAPATTTLEITKSTTTSKISAPTTTTEASTTTTAASTTTTAASTTTKATPAPKPTTVAPKPAEPEIASYYVEENNKTCILVTFAARLNISYGNGQYILYNLPRNDKFEKTSGNCGNETTEQSLVIIWMAENKDVNTLNLTFSLNTTSKPKTYSLKQAVFNLSSTVVPGSTKRLVLYHVGSFFETRQSHSYHCGRAQTLNLTKNTEPKSEVVGNVTLLHVSMEAYHSTDDKQFSAAIDCDGGPSDIDIVAISVGIALIALVVVVLIAYMVGRRRAQSRGYVSM